MGRTSSRHGWDKKCTSIRKFRNPFGNKIHGRPRSIQEDNIKWILKKLSVRKWTKLMWLKTGPSRKLLWTWQWIFGFHEMKGIFLTAEREKSFSVELVIEQNLFFHLFIYLSILSFWETNDVMFRFNVENVLCLPHILQNYFDKLQNPSKTKFQWNSSSVYRDTKIPCQINLCAVYNNA